MTAEKEAQIESAIQEGLQFDVRQRAEAIHLLHSGEKPDKVAEMFGVGVSTIYNWHRRWREEGLKGLSNKPKSDPKQNLKQARISRAKELLGKVVTVRSEPHIGGQEIDRLTAFSVVQFLEIIPDQTNPEWEWLKLDEGHYVNYDYPPNGLRFKLLPDQPSLPVDHYILTAYDAENNEIQRKILTELK